MRARARIQFPVYFTAVAKRVPTVALLRHMLEHKRTHTLKHIEVQSESQGVPLFEKKKHPPFILLLDQQLNDETGISLFTYEESVWWNLIFTHCILLSLEKEREVESMWDREVFRGLTTSDT